MPTLLCFGDSNTYGYDPRSYLGGRYPEHIRWTGLLRAAGWEVLNRGENGREIPVTAGQLASCADLLRRERPDLTAVMLGSNDLLSHPRFTAEDVTGRMETFLSYLRSHVPEARLLLIAPPPMVPGDWVTEPRLLTESARLGPCYRALAARLDLAFADAGAWGVDLCFDGVHFSPAGHRAFAAGLRAALEEPAFRNENA